MTADVLLEARRARARTWVRARRAALTQGLARRTRPRRPVARPIAALATYNPSYGIHEPTRRLERWAAGPEERTAWVGSAATVGPLLLGTSRSLRRPLLSIHAAWLHSLYSSTLSSS